jgi:VWFA-related protein
MPRAAIVTVCAILATAVTIHAQQPTFRTTVDLVNFGVAVVDKQGKPVTGLKAEDFQVLENGKPQSLKYFAAGDPEDAPPLHIGLLLDTSGSMAGDIRDSRTAAVKFVNTLDHAADVTLVDFDTEVRVARFGPNDYPRLVERIRGRKPDGWTALYDAIGVYLNGAQSQDGQKVLVLYTDGGDTTQLAHVPRHARPVQGVRTSRSTPSATWSTRAAAACSSAASSSASRTTGGQAYLPGVAKDLDGVFEKIGRSSPRATRSATSRPIPHRRRLARRRNQAAAHRPERASSSAPDRLLRPLQADPLGSDCTARPCPSHLAPSTRSLWYDFCSMASKVRPL